MIRVGMIGAGGIARTHAGYLGAMEEVRVAAVIDPVADRAAALAGDCGARVYDRLDTLLDDVDAVYVCSPPMAHREQVEAAAAAGKHVYLEKPIATTLEEGRAIAAVLSESAVRSMVGFNNRFRPAFRRWQSAVRSGEVGVPLSAWILRAEPSTPPPNSNWRTVPGLLCGITVESASHDIDLVRWVFGEIDLVAGSTATSLPELEGFDDSVNAVLWVAGGPAVTLTVCWSSAISMSSRGAVGTDGSICLVGPDMWTISELRRAGTGEAEAVEPIDPVEGTDLGYRGASEHFLECIREGVAPEVTPHDGLAALEVSLSLLSAAGDRATRSVGGGDCNRGT